jgi:hypothetical protein
LDHSILTLDRRAVHLRQLQPGRVVRETAAAALPAQIYQIGLPELISERMLMAAQSGSARGYQEFSAPLAIPTSAGQRGSEAVCLSIASVA